MTTIWLHLATVNEEFIAFNKAIDEEVIRARAQLKLDMIKLRKELDEQEKREIAAAKQRYLDELAAKKEKGNYMLIIGWSGIGGQISYYIDKPVPSAQIFKEGILTSWGGKSKTFSATPYAYSRDKFNAIGSL